MINDILKSIYYRTRVIAAHEDCWLPSQRAPPSNAPLDRRLVQGALGARTQVAALALDVLVLPEA
jgi:hypothetical protein